MIFNVMKVLFFFFFFGGTTKAFTPPPGGLSRRCRPRPVVSMSAEDVAGVIVGGGRIGSLLRSEGDAVMTRASGWPADAPAAGPIYVCVRNDSLEDVIAATPVERREDLVFLQNGWLLPFLEARGLGEATQGLVYFAVAKEGDAPVDGITDLNPDGLTAVRGKWAEAFQKRLATKGGGGLKCKVLNDRDAFLKAMLEKHVWICAFMLVGATHGGCTVGDVVKKHGAQFDSLANELAQAGARDLGVLLDDGYLPRLKAYARAVAHFPTAVKEFKWRNGYFFQLTRAAVERGDTDPCPTHTSLLYTLNLPLDFDFDFD
mmetsp:Transcript_21946/g.70656  ORF Transcript_21946/g.70656 Transcript_21946/m.70656 type:complete len:316 (+) Transcript_21946:454-1401(+)